MIVEAKVLYELQRGSYEELLQSLSRTICENSDKFGGDAVLFASFPDNAFVVNKSGEFFKIGFKNKNGIVQLGEASHLDVKVISEDEVTAKAVDDYFNGKSLADSLRSIVNLQERIENGSPFERAKTSLAVLFSGGQIWRKYLSENMERIGLFAWDAELGNLKLDVQPMFGNILEGESESGDVAEVTNSLMVLENKLFECLNKVRKSFKKYQSRTVGARDENSDETMVRFESFSGDYLDHLSEIAEFVSGSIKELNDGSCVVCAALVHDEVAKRYKDLELGGRFIRKVSNQFTQ